MIKRLCKTCDKKYLIWPYQTKINKFCSKKCFYKGRSLPKGDKHSNWIGDKITYSGIHQWLLYTFGKAIKCENSECLKKSKKYQWSLLKNKKYKRRRNHFWMLCGSCHRKYDMKECSKKTRKKMSQAHRFLKDITCPICNKVFHPIRATTKFCSKSCASKSHKKN